MRINDWIQEFESNLSSCGSIGFKLYDSNIVELDQQASLVSDYMTTTGSDEELMLNIETDDLNAFGEYVIKVQPYFMMTEKL